jgi:hypothetical protein
MKLTKKLTKILAALICLVLSTTLSLTAAAKSTMVWGCAFGNSTIDITTCASKSQVIVTPWVLTGYSDWNSKSIKDILALGKTPYVNMYIIAGMARNDWGLKDCNQGSPNLCEQGAEYIRQNKERIKAKYSEMSQAIGRDTNGNQVIIHIEPDLYQYSQHGLSSQEVQELVNGFNQSVKANIPNAKTVLDISPWANVEEFYKGFYGFDFAGLVGQQFDAEPRINGSNDWSKGYNDPLTYAKLKSILGLPIIVNTAFGVGGNQNPFNRSWSQKHLIDARVADGVAMVIQPSNDNGHYDWVIENY